MEWQTSAAMPVWICKHWSELDTGEVYRILQARARVFVVEQSCPYLDADDHDQASWHLWTEVGGAIAAYLRVVPGGEKYAEPSLGRIITAAEHRRSGLGKELVREGLRALAARCGDVPVRIGAQKYLERFYGELGFARAGDDYDEDGIPHLEMLRPPSARAT
jgi:ElaA protein